MHKRTWEDNAAEFAALDRGEGWPFARLVACSVGKGNGNGDPQARSRNDRSGLKVSANEFAERAGTSRPRVLRYLEAWDKAAADGQCVPSAELTPDDSPVTVEPDVAWESVYSAKAAGGRPRDSKAEDAATIIERRGVEAVVSALPPEVKAQVAAEAVRQSPQAERAAREAVEQAAQARHEQVIRDAGGQPGGVKAFEGDDITDWNHEVAGISIRMGNMRLDVRRARRLAAERGIDEARLGELLSESLTALTAEVFGQVPDTIEGLVQ